MIQGDFRGVIGSEPIRSSGSELCLVVDIFHRAAGQLPFGLAFAPHNRSRRRPRWLCKPSPRRRKRRVARDCRALRGGRVRRTMDSMEWVEWEAFAVVGVDAMEARLRPLTWYFRDQADVVLVYLFGSHARHTARPRSDLDIDQTPAAITK